MRAGDGPCCVKAADLIHKQPITAPASQAGAPLRARPSRQQHCDNNKYYQAARTAAPNKPNRNGQPVGAELARNGGRTSNIDVGCQDLIASKLGSYRDRTRLGLAINY